MKKIVSELLLVILIVLPLYTYAADGDLIVDGKLGVGTMDPLTRLHVVDKHVKFENDDGPQVLTLKSGYIDRYPYIQWRDGNNDRGAYFGWGIPNSYFELGLENGNYFLIRGDVRANRYYTSCSRKMKTNIADISGEEAIRVFAALKPVKYNLKKYIFKEDINKKGDIVQDIEEVGVDKRISFGFIAEDSPEIVTSADKDGISLMDVVTVLTKVVKEQQKMIKTQDERIRALESR